MSRRVECYALIVLALSLFCLSQVFADLATQTLSVSVPIGGHELKGAENGQELLVENFGRLLVPGKPNLPSKIFAVAIPPGAEVVEVTFDTGEGIVLPGFYEISPAPLPRVIGQEDPLIYARGKERYLENYVAVYGSDESYPQSVVEFVRTAGYRKYNLVDVRVTPCAYRPLSGQLTYYPDITLHVTYKIGDKERALIVDNLSRTEKIAGKTILNYDEAQSWYPQGPVRAKGLHDFVIITLDALTSHITPLVNWETSKGRNVQVVTTSWIGSNYTGYDLAEQMRNFLRDKYPSGEWGIEDVLLVGHYDDVPMRRTWQDLGYGKPETDFYYAELSLPDDQSWDDDEDHKYGESSDLIDFYNEVNVGRIPWSTPSTVQSICQKSVAYEQNDDDSFKKNILLLGAFFWDDDPNPRTDNAVLMEAKVDQPWMTDWSMTRMYEQGYSTYPMDYNINWNNVKNIWSQGTFAFVNWAGHGSPTSSHIYHGTGGAFVSNSTCPYLNDDYPAIIFADACSNSDTDYLNIGQAMMKQGGVGFLGATKVAYGSAGWSDPNDGSSQSLDYFYTTYVTSGNYTIGGAHQKALRDMYTNGLWYNNKYETFEWGALWGNPNLDMASHAPLSILFPDGLPEYLDPGVPDTIMVQIKEASDTYVPGSGIVHYRYDGGTYLTSPLASLDGDLYQAILPPAGCSDTPEYFFSIEGDSSGVIYSPGDAPTTVHTATPGELVILCSNDFEISSDWTLDPTHTAITGDFVRIDPNPTSCQPGDDATPDSGTYAWITAQNIGLGIDDVDKGISATRSPIINLSEYPAAHLSMMYFHGQRDQGDDPDGDFFRIDLSNDGGSTFPVNLVSFGDVTTAAIWRCLEVDLDEVIALSDQMVIRVQASEGPPQGDIVEGGLDDFLISFVQCAEDPPEAVNDLAIGFDKGDIRLWWTEPFSEGGVDRYVVYRSTAVGSPGDSLAGTTATTYTDVGAAGVMGTNYYYTVKAADGAGRKSEESNKVGEFDCGLINAPPE
jgi:hypothetical protein